MKTLTVCQPYAHLIATGEKRVENRNWPAKYRGTLAIHAGRSRHYLRTEDYTTYPDMAFGAVVAVATLDACLSLDAIRGDLAAERYRWVRDHEHTEGPWCWVLTNVIILPKPVACRGMQGLFVLPDDVEREVRGQFLADVPANF